MLVAGEDPRFIARRIVIFASEDVGMADPQALLVATAAAQAVQNVGLPEAGLNLAHAVVHLATAPKSNSVTVALGEAMADVRAGRGGPVPPHLRDAHYPGSRGLGHGRGYRYPHDDPRGVVRQQYVPDDLVGTDYYRPTDHGAERAVGERVPRLRRIVRGLGHTTRTPANAPVTASASTADRAAGGARAANESQSSADPEPIGRVAEAAGNAPVVSGTDSVAGAGGNVPVVSGGGSAEGVASGAPVSSGGGSVEGVAGYGPVVSGADPVEGVAGMGSGAVAPGTGSGADGSGTGSGADGSGTGSGADGSGTGSVAGVAESGDGAAAVAGGETAAGDAEGSDDSGDSAGEEQR
jgi:putative ATPase